MMVSTKGRYALMFMIDLAKNGDNQFISLSDISKRQKLSFKYLETVVATLNKAGFLESQRGKKGGYRLSRKPSDYNMAEILRVTEGSLAPVECLKQAENDCKRAEQCITLPLWIGLDSVIDEYLLNITLEDIICENKAKILRE